jgi:hypothetical protein
LAEPKVQGPKIGKPVFALVVFIPLVWLLAVTMTAGFQKIYHPDPRIGFLSASKMLDAKLPDLQSALAVAQASGVGEAAAAKAISDNRKMHFNNQLDAVVAAFFMAMVLVIAAISIWEWIALLTRRRAAALCESEAVWLPGYAVEESKPANVMGMVALTCALARELSGEAHMDRAQQATLTCHCANEAQAPRVHDQVDAKTREKLYVEMTEQRFNGVKRCC